MNTRPRKPNRHTENQTNPKDREKNEMLTALEFVLSHTDADNRFASGLSMHAAGRAWDQFLRMARKAVIDGQGFAPPSD